MMAERNPNISLEYVRLLQRCFWGIRDRALVASPTLTKAAEKCRSALDRAHSLVQFAEEATATAADFSKRWENACEAVTQAQQAWGRLMALWHDHRLSELQEQESFDLWADWDEELRKVTAVAKKAITAAMEFDGPAEELVNLGNRNWDHLASIMNRYDTIAKAGGVSVSIFFLEGKPAWAINLAESGQFKLAELVRMTDEQILAQSNRRTLDVLRTVIPEPTQNEEVGDGMR